MVVTDLDHLLKEASGSAAMKKALEFLADAVRAPPPDARVELDGDRMYAIVQSYTTRAERACPRFEAHRRYVDIQFVLSGTELCGWAPLQSLSVTKPYDEVKDIMFGQVPAEDMVLFPFPAGRIFVLYPWDAHAPCLAAPEPSPVRKVVVKIAIRMGL